MTSCSFLLVTSVRQAIALRTVVSTSCSSRFLSVGSLRLRSENVHSGGRRYLSNSVPCYGDQEGAPHFRRSSVPHPLAEELKFKLDDEQSYTLPHPIWSKEEAEAVKVTHIAPVTKTDKAAYFCVQCLRTLWDIFSGYKWGKWFNTLDEKKWLTRIIFLETVAGVPGMIAAMNRHLSSLRSMKRDHGWIHTLLEDAENERMHLLTALALKKPGPFFRLIVMAGQGVFVTLFWASYQVSPRFCHRFVGYLEEQAVGTYTECLHSIDNGDLKTWALLPAPPIAVQYWKLKKDAMMRDVILAIRADEAHHRSVGAQFSLKLALRHQHSEIHTVLARTA
ncbi:hypothetical protein EMCRGX_G011222 [Ephydatia muelleri]